MGEKFNLTDKKVELVADTNKSLNKEKLEKAKKDNFSNKRRLIFKSKITYLIIISLILIIFFIIFLVNLLINKSNYKEYEKYEEKMKTYGFDILYNNKSAKSSDAVTNAEALKLAIAAVYNVSDISRICCSS